MKSVLLGCLVTTMLAVGMVQIPAPGAATPDDTLVIGYNRISNNLHPGVNTGLSNIWANMLLYDGLVIHDAEGKVHPGLAKRWESSKDGLVWTFTLREDVTFHSGRKFTAKDVKAHFDNWKTFATATKIACLDKTEAVDDYTVRFSLKYPTLVFLTMISQTEWSFAGIPDSESVKKYGKDYGVIPESVSGTGPYKLTRWVHGDRMEFARNPEYKWGPVFYRNRGPAHIAKVIIRSIEEDASRSAALDRHEIDMDISLPDKDAARFTKMKGMRVITKPKITAHHLGFNHKKPLWSDIRVRQALLMSYDQDVIIKVAYNGYAKKAVGLWSEFVEGHTPKAEMATIVPPYNPAKAGQLLEQAGWSMRSDGVRYKDGKPLRFTCYIYSESAASLMTVLQQQWREIGADVEIRQLEYAAFQKAVKEGEHDLRYSDSTHSTADFSYWFTCAAIPTPNHMHYCDPVTDKYYERSQRTIVNSERIKAFQDMEKDFIKRAILLPMPHTMWIVGIWENVTDLELHPIHAYYKLMDAKKTAK
jgi:peptide/nickel transport system substrate-binding protein